MDKDRIQKTLAQSFVVGIQETRALPEDLELFQDHGLGGVILFARNLEEPRQIWELNQALGRAAANAGRAPLFSMVDQEGGSVARLKGAFTHGPDLCELGAAGDARAVFEHGLRMGRELVAAGFNWNLAPVVDVHGLPDGVMARRSLGPDPDQVGLLAASFIQGLERAGCLSCAKHFPGLGRTNADTHKHRPVVDLSLAQLKEMELPPFRSAASAGVSGIMVCHAVFSRLDPDNPASLSARVIQDLLRRELGYGGCVLSDDLEMGALTASLEPDEAAVRAYLAGCDLLLICHRPQFALQALERLTAMALAGELPMERIQAGARRISALKERLPASLPPYAELQGLLNLA